MGCPLKFSRFTSIINDLNGVWHIVTGSVHDYDYRWRFIESIREVIDDKIVDLLGFSC